METIQKPAISLMQNPDINFLTTKTEDENIIVTGETSIDLMVGDEISHPHYKKRLSVHKIIELRPSRDIPSKTHYTIACHLV